MFFTRTFISQVMSAHFFLLFKCRPFHIAFDKRIIKYENKGQNRKRMQFSARKFVGQLDLLIHSLCFWKGEEGGVHNPQTNLCCFCNTAKVRLMNMLMKLQWEFWHYFITSTRLESNNTMGLHVLRNCCGSRKNGSVIFIMQQKLQLYYSKIVIIILYVSNSLQHIHNGSLLRQFTDFHVSVFWSQYKSIVIGNLLLIRWHYLLEVYSTSVWLSSENKRIQKIHSYLYLTNGWCNSHIIVLRLWVYPWIQVDLRISECSMGKSSINWSACFACRKPGFDALYLWSPDQCLV